ncbi:EscU/YscU/HrcU family type III secretion system export apparatus switch protein [Pseudomonadota bacterium]
MNDEKTPKAVALKWEGGKEAPRVTAKGEGQLAEEILALAKACDIPIQENATLTFALAQLELDEEIPEMLYLAVAEVIAFAYYVSGRHSVTGESEV